MIRLLVVLAITLVSARAEVVPQIHTHAHNDYEHKRPLFDALSHGFCSVEADIYLVNGQLLVAHNRRDVKPERTLQALYLEPLRRLAREHSGKIYGSEPRFFLLIDLKSPFAEIYPALKTVLSDYSDLVTHWQLENGTWKIHSNAVTVVLTGNAQSATLPPESERFSGIDGHLDQLRRMKAGDPVLWISENWKSFFHWNGKGQISTEERAKLRDYVARAHAKGKLIRFWNAPENTTFWTELAHDDVDLLNADDLAGMEKFLTTNPYPGTLLDAPQIKTERLQRQAVPPFQER
jgi:hypothetical protein